MNIRKITGALVNELRDSVARQGLSDRKDIGALALSTESMDENTRAVATTARAALVDVVQNSIDLVISTEASGMSLTQAQRDAASRIASLAIDPVAGMQAIANATTPTVGKNGVLVSAQELGVTDSIDAATLSTESFDGQSMNNAMYFSIAYNLFAARQDAFGETFFPTITIDPAMSGIAIGTEVTSLYRDFARGIDGAQSRSKFTKVTLAKAIYDNNLLNADRNKAVPVSRPENAAVLVPALATTDATTGVDIVTAPIKIGTTVDLLGISQTDAMLAKGTMDAYDSLDRSINLTTILIGLTADVTPAPIGGVVQAPVATTEYFRVPVGMLPHSNFTYTTQGHDKDLALSFETSDVAFLTSATVTHDGSASAILATLPVGHKVHLHLKLTGDGNTQYGDVAVYSTVAEVATIYDAANNALVSTAADFLTISTAFAAMAVVGYELEAYLTNSNLRTQGQLVTIDRYEQVYSVPVRSGVSVVMPINSTGSDDSRLVGQVQTTGYRMSLDAVDTLVSFTDSLKLLTANGANTNISLMGVGRHHVDSYFSEAPLDLAVIVDSESSSERGDDIRAALISRIRDEVYRAYTASKFNIAHDMIRGNSDSPVGVIIGTSSRIKNYLTIDGDIIDLGSGFIAKVVSSSSLAIGDSMYIAFSDHASGDRNTTVDPISFGQCLWAPTITTDVASTVNGATTRRFQTHPRYLHIVNLPIMIRLNVTNIESVLGKVTRYTRAV